jgi:predicted Abi (CAAX) family protease
LFVVVLLSRTILPIHKHSRHSSEKSNISRIQQKVQMSNSIFAHYTPFLQISANWTVQADYLSGSASDIFRMQWNLLQLSADSIRNKKSWEALIASYSFKRKGPHRNECSNNSSLQWERF